MRVLFYITTVINPNVYWETNELIQFMNMLPIHILLDTSYVIIFLIRYVKYLKNK